jgi:hypothetical protein
VLANKSQDILDICSSRYVTPPRTTS